jgi:hypothetical protein
MARYCFGFVLALVLAGLVPGSGLAHSAAPDSSWLPAHTVGCVVFSDLNGCRRDDRTTALGKLLASDGFGPFFESVWNNQKKGPLTVPFLLGCTLDELAEATQGSLVLALLGGHGRPPALVLLLDTRQRERQARKLLETLEARLEQLGGRKTGSAGADGASVYDLPDCHALGAIRQLAVAGQDGCLIISTRLDALCDLVARRSAPGRSLADAPAFQATTARTVKETPGAQVSWFIEPLGSWAAWRTLTAQKVRGQDLCKILHQEGFAGLKGCGGAARIDGQSGEVLLRGAVWAPRPYQRSMRMLTFAEGPVTDAPAWVPSGVSLYGAIDGNLLAMFDAFGTFFDALYGEGEEGVFDDVIHSLKDDPIGPRVDVRNELLTRFRRPLLVVGMPRTGRSTDDRLFGFPIEEERGVAAVIDRLFKGDSEARRLEFGTHGMWQVYPLGRPPNLKSEAALNGKDEDEKNRAPSEAVTVHKDMLLTATSPHLIRQLFSEGSPLSGADDYRRVCAGLDRVAGKTASVRLFFRLGPLERQVLAELRAGPKKAAGATTGILRSLFPPSLERPGTGIDFKKLPAPDALATFLEGHGGVSATLTGDTWTFVVTLGK